MDEAYVGIDPSYSGLAISVLRGDEHETVLAAFPDRRYGTGVDRLIAIRSYVAGVLGQCLARSPIAHIALEGYAFARVNGQAKSGELCGAIKHLIHGAFETQVRYPTIVPPPSLKLFATGKGNSAKNVVLLSVYRKWEAVFDDDNKADAYVLARMAQALAEPDRAVHAYERKALASLTVHTESVLTRR